MPPLSHRVVHDETTESMVKVQTDMWIVVTGTVTREGLGALLAQLHQEVKRKRGSWLHHDHVTHVGIYAYMPKQRPGEDIPLASLYSIQDKEPQIAFYEVLLGLAVPQDKRDS